ncbi:hypothetical protein D3C73_925910 [compost metagenome]
MDERADGMNHKDNQRMGDRDGHDIAHGGQQGEQQRNHRHHEVDHPVDRILGIADGDVEAVDGDDEHDHIAEHVGNFADGFAFEGGLQRLQDHAQHAHHHNRDQQLAVIEHLMPHEPYQAGEDALEAKPVFTGQQHLHQRRRLAVRKKSAILLHQLVPVGFNSVQRQVLNLALNPSVNGRG